MKATPAALPCLLALLADPARGALRPPPASHGKSYDWIACDAFLDHAATIAASVGLRDARDAVPGGRSNLACERIFDAAKEQDVVDAVVNMAEHVRGRRLEDADLKAEVRHVVTMQRMICCT